MNYDPGLAARGRVARKRAHAAAERRAYEEFRSRHFWCMHPSQLAALEIAAGFHEQRRHRLMREKIARVTKA